MAVAGELIPSALREPPPESLLSHVGPAQISGVLDFF